MFTLFFVFLGSSAAVFGSWLERVGPRKAGVVAAFCWGGGFFISALGVHLHQIWLMWLGSGVIGGCGLGLGYISPVSTLIKWFPDRRGLATGMAIMGFGGGAMIGAPLADLLMRHFATPQSVGVWQTFLALGCLYFTAMMIGAMGYRVPPADWKPAGWTPKTNHGSMITSQNVSLSQAWRTPQFWLLWGVLCLNVSAGIGIIGMSSPMLQEVFGGKLIGVAKGLADLDTAQKAQVASIGAGFAALLSLFNIIGRIGWASASDWLGRKRTYMMFFLLGGVLYCDRALRGPHRERSPVRRALLPHPHDVRRRLLDDSRLPRGPVRHQVRRRYSRSPPHRLVDGRGTGSDAGHLHPRVSAGPRRAERAGVQRHHVHPRGPPPARVCLQPRGSPRGQPLPHAGIGRRARPRFRSFPGAAMTDPTDTPRPADDGARTGSSPILLAAAWIGVGVPMLWGMWMTLQKAAILFR